MAAKKWPIGGNFSHAIKCHVMDFIDKNSTLCNQKKKKNMNLTGKIEQIYGNYMLENEYSLRRKKHELHSNNTSIIHNLNSCTNHWN